MKRLIIALLVCLVLTLPVACNGNDGGSIVPPSQDEQTQTGGETQSPEEEESENKGKPVTPIQNGGTITTK